ncbi:MAG: lactate racemase domain-containing protein, partial [Kofleriaceae bacterium]
MIELPYGRTPYPLDPGPSATVLTPPGLPPPAELGALLDAALAAPVGRPPLGQMVRPGARVTIIVSDATRREPRRAFLQALARHLPAARWTLALATGTHGPSPIADLDLPEDLLRGVPIINHDGHRADDLVELGVTTRGTPVRVHRCVIEADLVIATGCIRPHYFAGFGAGAKAIFPGLGEAASIRTNHAWKTHPRARAGIVDDNPCRADLEEAVRRVPAPTFLLNGVAAPDGLIHAAVAGDLEAAFRAGAALARPWFHVAAPPAALVIASDALPVTASLYQAAKIAAAVAPLVEPNGTLVLAAECPDGIGPLETVNEAIFRIGVLPRLPPQARLVLVSDLT